MCLRIEAYPLICYNDNWPFLPLEFSEDIKLVLLMEQAVSFHIAGI